MTSDTRSSIVRDPARVSFHEITLQNLLLEAYGVKKYQMLGLGDAAEVYYDVDANPGGMASRADVSLMLQSLLAERLGLVVRHESRDTALYTMTVAQTGLRMTRVDDENDTYGPMSGSRQPSGDRGIKGVTNMRRPVALVSGYLDRPLIDLTGLTGQYNVDLKWFDAQPGPPSVTVLSDGGGGTLFKSMEKELGLKVEAKRMPIDMLVVEHVNRAPTEN